MSCRTTCGILLQCTLSLPVQGGHFTRLSGLPVSSRFKYCQVMWFRSDPEVKGTVTKDKTRDPGRDVVPRVFPCLYSSSSVLRRQSHTLSVTPSAPSPSCLVLLVLISSLREERLPVSGPTSSVERSVDDTLEVVQEQRDSGSKW